jgi:hypothetical protein
MPGLVVLGARNLGGAVVDRFLADGWRAAAVARSEETLAAVRGRGALALEADATEPSALASALARAREELGGLDVIVNALSVAAPASGEPWGGGPLADTSLEQWGRWAAAISAGCRSSSSLGERVRSATVAAAGRSSRSRMLRHCAPRPVRPCSRPAISRCERSPAPPRRSCARRASARLAAEGVPDDQRVEQTEIANAVAFLTNQGPWGVVYELTVTAAGRPWVH